MKSKNNFFHFYELPMRLRFDRQEILNKYYALSKKYHPDHQDLSMSDEEKQIVLEQSIAVNTAKSIFCSVDKTIEYVLKLKHKINERDEKQIDPVFLMEVMELNEQIDEAKQRKNTTLLQNAKTNIDYLTHKIYQEVASLIDNYKDGMEGEDIILEKIKSYYLKKKYLNRMYNSLG